MFIIKNKYYFYIDNSESVNLEQIKVNKKIAIIYRNNAQKETINKVINFRKKCKKKKIEFFIANDYSLARKCKADGLYISAYNKKIYHNIKVIGSAHSFREINQKILQRCETIILSKLFYVDYKKKAKNYGIVKFNLISNNYKVSLIPLGGIKQSNLLKINLIKSNGLALYREIKKKPVISNRLF